MDRINKLVEALRSFTKDFHFPKAAAIVVNLVMAIKAIDIVPSEACSEVRQLCADYLRTNRRKILSNPRFKGRYYIRIAYARLDTDKRDWHSAKEQLGEAERLYNQGIPHPSGAVRAQHALYTIATKLLADERLAAERPVNVSTGTSPVATTSKRSRANQRPRTNRRSRKMNPSDATASERARVFLSYASKDLAIVQSFVDHLNSHDEIAVLWNKDVSDLDNNSREKVDELLRNSSDGVIFYSEHSKKSGWCNAESSYILMRSHEQKPFRAFVVSIDVDRKRLMDEKPLLSAVGGKFIKRKGGQKAWLEAAGDLAKAILKPRAA
jgi:hypothetical protein